MILSSLSDHDIIDSKRKVNNIKYSDSIISFRDYKKYDHTKINAELSSTDWQPVYKTNDVDSTCSKIENILAKTTNNHAPIISKRIKGKRSPQITRELKKEMNCCDALRQKFQRTNSEEDHNSYKKQRNKTNIPVRKAKKKFNKNFSQIVQIILKNFGRL